MSTIQFPKDVLKIIRDKVYEQQLREKDEEISDLKHIIKLIIAAPDTLNVCEYPGCQNADIYDNENDECVPIYGDYYVSPNRNGIQLCHLHYID